jgi:hypothetical protein
MSFILQNIEKRLKRSVINRVDYNVEIVSDINEKKQNISLKDNISFVVKKLLFNFLIFFSKKLVKKKKNAQNFLLFLKFYNYYNYFFFNNKIKFFKKYFLKKNGNIFYFNKLFLSTKQVRLKPCLHRLKDRRLAFYKKHIWSKNKRFRKKNILIFNKLFFRRYSSARFEQFTVDSFLFFLGLNKHKNAKIFSKRFLRLFHKNYYYLFLHKHYIISKPRKKFFTKKMISFNHKHRTYAKIFVNRKFFAHRRRRSWRRVYYSRRTKMIWKRCVFLSFNGICYDKLYFKKYKKNKRYVFKILKQYLTDYAIKLSIKHSYNKNFYKEFFYKRNFKRRLRNIMYFFKWKPKKYNFSFFAFLIRNKNIKKIIFSAIWFKFFYKKIFWRKKKISKLFLLFYYNNFFLNKVFLLFNSFLKIGNLGFSKQGRKKFQRRQGWAIYKRRRYTVFIKKIRRRVLKKKYRRKFLRFFIILLFFKLMKKHKRSQKFFLFRNSFFLNTLKKMKLSLLSSVLLGREPLYYKNNTSLNLDIFFSHKKNLKNILLLNKKK